MFDDDDDDDAGLGTEASAFRGRGQGSNGFMLYAHGALACRQGDPGHKN
jgi:hypothetical protein